MDVIAVHSTITGETTIFQGEEIEVQSFAEHFKTEGIYFFATLTATLTVH